MINYLPERYAPVHALSTNPRRVLGKKNAQKLPSLARIALFLWLFLPFYASAQVQNLAGHSYGATSIYLKLTEEGSSKIEDYPDLLDRLNFYGLKSYTLPFSMLGGPSLDRTFHIFFGPGLDLDRVVEDLNGIDAVDYAERVPLVTLDNLVPNDPAISYYLGSINGYQAFDLHTGGNAVVAIVDDAVQTTHQDLDGPGHVVSEWDVTDNTADANPPHTGPFAATPSEFGHGTSVAGVSSSLTNNSIGGASIGWNNQLMAVKCRGDLQDIDIPAENELYVDQLYQGVEWAASHGANVINMSWGSYDYSQAHYDVIRAAANQGAILIGTAGNNGISNPRYPGAYGSGTTQQAWEIADYRLVIAVAAIDASNNRSVWSGGLGNAGSNFGAWVDVCAYGTGIKTTAAGSSGGGAENTGYLTGNGTSLAAPQVAGLAGLMKSYKPGKTAAEIIDCILGTANDDIYGPAHPSNLVGTLGTGRIDAYQAMLCISGDCPNVAAAIVPSSLNFCPGSSVTLSANNGAVGYNWSTGASSQEITVTTAGTYTVTVTFPGNCTDTDEVTISNSSSTLQLLTFENSGNVPNDGILCGNDAVSLTAYWGNTYHWSQNNAETPSLDLIVDPTMLPATFTFTVTVTDVGGCVGVTEVKTVSITWQPDPTPSLAVEENSGIPDDGIICLGSSAKLHVDAGNTYTWSTGETTSVITVAPTVTTTYSVTATNSNGCFTIEEITIYVNGINSGILVTETSGGWGNSEIFCGDAATLTANGGTNYLWSTGETTPEITVSPIVTTTYTVTVTNGNDCTATHEVTIVVVPANSLPIGIMESSGTPDDGIICPGKSVTLSAPAGSSYAWNTGSNNDKIDVNPIVTTTYSVTVTTPSGCMAVSTVTITVLNNDGISIEVDEQSGSWDNNEVFCGDPAEITASGGTGYVWSNNATTATIVVMPTATTTYTVTVTNAGDCTATASVTITVDPHLNAPITIVESSGIPNDGVICPNSTVTLTAPSGVGYLWSTGETTASIQVAPMVTTNYTVTVTTANGCVGSATRTISVISDVPATIYLGGSLPLSCGQSIPLVCINNGTFLWSTGETTAVITVSPLTTTTYSITVSNGNECSTTGSIEVEVTPIAVPPITVVENSGTPNDGIVCLGSSVSMTASGGTSYLWNTNETTSSIVIQPTSSNVYSVTVSNANGCTAVQTTPIKVLDPAAVTLVAHENSGTADDGIVCSGSSAMLVVTSPGASFLWSTGAVTSNIQVTPTATTTYTVTVTNVDGCTGTASYEVSVCANPLNAGFTNTPDPADCHVVAFAATASNSCATETWDFGDGNSAGGSSVLHSYANNGTYTVVYSVESQCGTATSTATVVVNCSTGEPFVCGCPQGANNYNVGSSNTNTLVTGSGLPATSVNNACIAIAGNLVIDDNTNTAMSYSFNNCDIRMQPGSSITVGDKNTLNIKGGHIYGCANEKMWRSIFTEAHAKINIVGVTIEDAQHAITLNNKVAATINSNHFIKNYVGIYSPPGTGPLFGGFQSLTILSNEFHCQNLTLHSAFDNTVSFSPGATSYAGIWLNDLGASWNIGDFVHPPNTFHDIRNGIILQNVSAAVSRCEFKNILTSNLHPLPTGYGVHATGTSQLLTVQYQTPTDFGYPTTDNFDNCWIGVEANGVPATVTNNTMKNMQFYGIKFITSGPNPLIANDNKIDTKTIGVGAIQCDMSTKLIIRRNEIDVDKNAPPMQLDKGIGISLSEQSLPHALALVDNNTINIWSSNKAIALTNSNTVTVNFNHIFLKDGSRNISGIESNNGANLTVHCNDVTSNSQFQGTINNNIGLLFGKTSSSEISCNPLLKSRTGAQFAMPSLGTSIQGITFDNHLTGLQLMATLNIEDQADKGNVWYNMAGNTGALSAVSPSPVFIVHTTAAPYFPPNPVPGIGFFQTIGTSGTPYTCPSCGPYPLVETPPPARVKSDLDGKVARNEIDASGARLWMAKRELYEAIDRNPSFLEEDGDMAEFWNKSQGEVLGQLYAIESGRNAEWNLDPVVASDLAAKLGEISAGVNDLRTADELLPSNPTDQELAALASVKAAIILDLEPVQENYTAAQNSLRSARGIAANSLIGENKNIAVSELWEENDRTVNEIYLLVILQYKPITGDQITSLAAIAAQCPENGGDAVYKARGLYAMIDPEAEYDDAAICGGPDSEGRQPGDRKENGVAALAEGNPAILSVFPSPASNEVNVFCALPTGFDGFAIVTDLLGNEISRVPVKDNNLLTIATSLWKSGVYVCTLTGKGGETFSRKKITIVK